MFQVRFSKLSLLHKPQWYSVEPRQSPDIYTNNTTCFSPNKLHASFPGKRVNMYKKTPKKTNKHSAPQFYWFFLGPCPIFPPNYEAICIFFASTKLLEPPPPSKKKTGVKTLLSQQRYKRNLTNLISSLKSLVTSDKIGWFYWI